MSIPVKMVSDLGTSGFPEQAKKLSNRDLVIQTSGVILNPLPECQHRKGGLIGDPNLRGPAPWNNGVLDGMGQGTSPCRSVIKHRLPNGVWLVLCTRCNKEWRSADKLTGTPATPGFKEAFNWMTDNVPSSSGQFNFEGTYEFRVPIQNTPDTNLSEVISLQRKNHE